MGGTSIKKTKKSKEREVVFMRDVKSASNLPKQDPRYAPKRKHKKLVKIAKKLKF